MSKTLIERNRKGGVSKKAYTTLNAEGVLNRFSSKGYRRTPEKQKEEQYLIKGNIFYDEVKLKSPRFISDYEKSMLTFMGDKMFYVTRHFIIGDRFTSGVALRRRENDLFNTGEYYLVNNKSKSNDNIDKGGDNNDFFNADTISLSNYYNIDDMLDKAYTSLTISKNIGIQLTKNAEYFISLEFVSNEGSEIIYTNGEDLVYILKILETNKGTGRIQFFNTDIDKIYIETEEGDYGYFNKINPNEIDTDRIFEPIRIECFKIPPIKIKSNIIKKIEREL